MRKIIIIILSTCVLLLIKGCSSIEDEVAITNTDTHIIYKQLDVTFFDNGETHLENAYHSLLNYLNMPHQITFYQNLAEVTEYYSVLLGLHIEALEDLNVFLSTVDLNKDLIINEINANRPVIARLYNNYQIWGIFYGIEDENTLLFYDYTINSVVKIPISDLDQLNDENGTVKGLIYRESYQDIINIRENSPVYWGDKMMQYYVTREWNSFWVASEKYEKLEGDASGIDYMRAFVYIFIENDPDSALVPLQRFESNNPNAPNGAELWFVLYILRGELEEAEKHLEVALTWNIEVETYNYISQYYSQIGEKNKAEIYQDLYLKSRDKEEN